MHAIWEMPLAFLHERVRSCIAGTAKGFDRLSPSPSLMGDERYAVNGKRFSPPKKKGGKIGF